MSKSPRCCCKGLLAQNSVWQPALALPWNSRGSCCGTRGTSPTRVGFFYTTLPIPSVSMEPFVYCAFHCRFESSSHAISMSAYLREQRRELYSRSGELQGGWLSSRKASFLEEDLKAFIACELEVCIHRFPLRQQRFKHLIICFFYHFPASAAK